ncbi:unnamed protein product [Withania somnifera]
MNGAKRSAEAVGCKNTSVGERSALERSLRASGGGRSGSENVGLSNANIGENPMPRKPKDASSQCSNTRRYGAEVTHAILPGKARTTLSKRVPVPETDTDHVWGLTPAQCRKVKEVGDLMTGEPATEAPVNGGRNYNGPKASQKVTEACKGFLGPDGDWPSSAKAEGSLTARPTRRAGTKVGLSDPTVPTPRAHIDGKVWHLDVGSSPPGAVVCSKGWAVRPLKRYVSWVQNVVRQFGPYPVWALEH